MRGAADGGARPPRGALRVAGPEPARSRGTGSAGARGRLFRRARSGDAGHRPRLDACTVCGRAYPFPRPALGAGGVVCEACAREDAGMVTARPATLAAFEWLRSERWEEALVMPIGRSENESGAFLDAQVSRLMGQRSEERRGGKGG